MNDQTPDQIRAEKIVNEFRKKKYSIYVAADALLEHGFKSRLDAIDHLIEQTKEQ